MESGSRQLLAHCTLLFLLYSVARQQHALPIEAVLQHRSHLMRSARQTNTTSDTATRDDCHESTIGPTSLVDEPSQEPPQIMSCLNVCANCVKQWRSGLFDGERCANDCVQHNADDQHDLHAINNLLETECDSMKYFNTNMILG